MIGPKAKRFKAPVVTELVSALLQLVSGSSETKMDPQRAFMISTSRLLPPQSSISKKRIELMNPRANRKQVPSACANTINASVSLEARVAAVSDHQVRWRYFW